jgi:hypothetical protein
MPQFIRTLTYAQFGHLVSAGIVTGLLVAHTLTVTTGVPLLALILGVPLGAGAFANSSTTTISSSRTPSSTTRTTTS